MEISSEARTPVIGSATVPPLGKDTSEFVEVTVNVAPLTGIQPPLRYFTLSRPVSPLSRMPSVSQDSTLSSSDTEITETFAFWPKSSTTPARVVEVRVGDFAHVPAPRVAKPVAI